jgi:alpha-L-fucosidase 2
MIWFDRPAGDDWNAALPIGNGRLGAMVFGNVGDERIQLNEDTVWSGGGRDRINPDARAALPEIRRLLREGRPAEAEVLTQRCLGGIPDSMLMYQPLGDLWLELAHPDRPRLRPAEEFMGRFGIAVPPAQAAVEAYRRELDLASGEARVSYRIAGATYRRSHLASFPDGVVAIRLECDRPGAISFAARITRGTASHYAARYLDTVGAVDGDALLGLGRSGGALGHTHALCLRVRCDGGRFSIQGETLVVEGADAVLLVIGGATAFRHADPAVAVRAATAEACSLGWEALRARHRADHAALFSRVRLDLGPGDDAVPTDKRVARLREGGSDPDLLRLFFDFGRYLLIASSRPGSLPATLQGRWCQDMEPPWGGKYTININTQMNYWPAESCALGECHEPLFDLLDRLRVTGAEAARRMYGCGGFVVHHNTDLAADACPTDRNLTATYWPMGGAWLSLHLHERWLFTRDPADLARAWPVLREAARFFLDFLSEDAQGRLVVSPSCSPENLYRLPSGAVSALCAGASMDSQIVERLFTAAERCAAALAVEPAFAARCTAARARLPAPAVSRHGRLQEWADDHDEVEPGHRHISHLFALHPGGAIDPVATPTLATAARASLDRRLAHGGGGTGWSRAWVTNFFARLLDGAEVHRHLTHLVANCTLPNLFDNHPPFQIDGNFGACAAIAECLVQSHRESEGLPEIHLLPALPPAWPSGSVTGLRVRGGGTLERLAWREGRLTEARLRAAPGSRFRVRAGTRLSTVIVAADGCADLG